MNNRLESKEIQKCLFSLFYGINCDLYYLHEDMKTQFSKKIQITLWVDQSDIFCLTSSNKNHADHNIYQFHLNLIGNITDGINLTYKHLNVRNIFQVTVFSTVDTEYQHYILGFESREQKELCLTGLMHLIVQELDQSRFLKQQIVLLLGEDNLPLLNLHDVKNILDLSKIYLSKRCIKSIFFDAIIKNKQGITQKEFIEKFEKISHKEELQQIFLKYSSKNTDSEHTMTANQFRKFLQVEQYQKTKIEDVIKTMLLFIETQSQDLNQSTMNFKQFSDFIFSLHCQIFSNIKTDQNQDMTQPITDYFINSSRNSLKLYNIDPTYTVNEPEFISLFFLLENGVRSLDLEIWENENHQPICIIGVFQNQSLDLRHVLSFLKREAFKQNQYGLFIHIQGHCSFEATNEVWRQFSDILSDQIYLQQSNDKVPSPLELINNFIITGLIKLKQEVNAIPEDFYPQDSCEYRVSDFHERIILPSNNRASQTTQKMQQNTTQDKTQSFIARHDNMDKLLTTLSQISITDQNEQTNQVQGPQKVSQYFIEKKEFNLKVKDYISSNFNMNLKKIQNKMSPISLYEKGIQQMDMSKITNQIFLDPLSLLYSYFQVTPEQLRGLKRNYPQLIICLDGLNQQKHSQLSKMMSGQEKQLLEQCNTQNNKYQDLQNVTITSSSDSDSDNNDSLISEEYITDYNKNMVMFYPTYQRLDSSNSLIPQAFSCGFSFPMVDHNNIDLNFMYNYAKFLENGNCGYILMNKARNSLFKDKTPKINIIPVNFSQLNKSSPSNSQNKQVSESSNKLVIEVISGYQLQGQFNVNADQIDPRVQVCLIDPCYDQTQNINQSCKSTQSPQNWFHPIFNLKCTFNFRNMDTAVVIFMIFNKLQDQVIAWNAAPLSIIKQGYRVVPLRDKFLNELYNSYLLCHIKIKI